MLSTLRICGPLHEVINFPGFDPGTIQGLCREEATGNEAWCGLSIITNDFAAEVRAKLPDDFRRYGVYRHAKSQMYYQLIDLAYHIREKEWYAWYCAKYPDPGTPAWLRMLSTFLGNVKLDGREVPRFEFLGPIIPR